MSSYHHNYFKEKFDEISMLQCTNNNTWKKISKEFKDTVISQSIMTSNYIILKNQKDSEIV
jgi:hypothetical protein